MRLRFQTFFNIYVTTITITTITNTMAVTNNTIDYRFHFSVYNTDFMSVMSSSFKYDNGKIIKKNIYKATKKRCFTEITAIIYCN